MMLLAFAGGATVAVGVATWCARRFGGGVGKGVR